MSFGEQNHPKTPLKIAISSTNGHTVDTHFGHTTQFVIYERHGDGFRKTGQRQAQGACAQTPQSAWCGSGPHPMDALVDLVRDCQGVISRQMGECAEQRLDALGVLAFVTDDDIETALSQLLDGGYLDAQSQHPAPVQEHTP